MRARLVVALWLVGVAVACGGRSGLLPGEQQGSVGGGGGGRQQPGAGSSAGSPTLRGSPSAGEGVLACRDTDCSDSGLDCAPGSHLETLPGECCPACVTDEPLPCDQAQLLYRIYQRDELLKYASLGRCAASGCAPFVENNRCTITCGTLIPAQFADGIEQELKEYADKICEACPTPQAPACLPWPPFSCFLDSCSFDSSHG